METIEKLEAIKTSYESQIAQLQGLLAGVSSAITILSEGYKSDQAAIDARVEEAKNALSVKMQEALQ